MSRLTELLKKAKTADPQLGADLEAEIIALTKRRTFGLVFEQHQPEAVELPGRAVRRGDKVRVLPPRGETKAGDQRLWRVTRIEHVDGQRASHLTELDAEAPESQIVPTDDLVVVAEFRDRIYPGLAETGRVERGGDKPHHTVINAENYHALEMLTYTHRHAIDAIYIDPPYNSGARDWKYNNDYVAVDDDYRHSKWLAFMERRLKIARELLNPEDSVLIVTIDEKEYLRLGLLLEQIFPEARIQMVSSVISAKGSARSGEFSRSNEFIFFVMFGRAVPAKGLEPTIGKPVGYTGSSGNTLGEIEVDWGRTKRNGKTGRRSRARNGFYPIYLESKSGKLHSVGMPLADSDDWRDVVPPEGTEAIWPIQASGAEQSWGLSRSKITEYYDLGFLKIGKLFPEKKSQKAMIYHLTDGYVAAAKEGSIKNVGTTHKPRWVHSDVKTERPTTVWHKTSHEAGWHGTRLINALLPGVDFDFAKSLYAVEDAIRFFTASKPDATILDFFSGSGTTAHAVMRLNKQDGGRRQSISVTNNEVSADEQKRLRSKGLRPGDPEWEALGICDYVTKPRVTASIKGKSSDGNPIRGSYKFTDEFPMADGLEENAVFFTLTYESPLSVQHNRAYERVAPILWLRAGSRGRIIYSLGEEGWSVSESYGVLENLDLADQFIEAVRSSDGIGMVYVVTDDESAFQMVCRDLPSGVAPVRLYESYLQNFEINTGRIF